LGAASHASTAAIALETSCVVWFGGQSDLGPMVIPIVGAIVS
jgi:coproporphyrinogen III oxidase